MNLVEPVCVIQLIGPGGAGKTTVGLALAKRLGIRFIDLDEQFTARCGDISSHLAARGYAAYGRQNVEVYLDTMASVSGSAVLALSSGFMTYDDDVHRDYRRICRDILESPTTAALLPSLDRETCVAETVRRQLTRPFSRTAEREEDVIRARFEVYRTLPIRKFETMQPIERLIEELAGALHD